MKYVTSLSVYFSRSRLQELSRVEDRVLAASQRSPLFDRNRNAFTVVDVSDLLSLYGYNCSISVSRGDSFSCGVLHAEHEVTSHSVAIDFQGSPFAIADVLTALPEFRSVGTATVWHTVPPIREA